ncbi:MAG TPA: polysaccharide deacetylase family protein [Pseudogracilibacillus sp.]|nr:polysaccharide deacetylase family protein [Pseudogracilibacillus sp.]
MKKILILLIGTMLFLVACNDNNDKKQEEDTDVQQESEEENNKENEKKEEKEEENKPETEEVEPLYSINEEIWSLEPLEEETNSKVALLTIDDAPDTYALEMAETLEKLDVDAIFFVNGHFLETDEEKEMLKKIYDKGFMIGNHTYSHSDLQTLSEEEQKEEITSVSEQVEDITGEKPVFFRAPFGHNTDYSQSIAKEEGMVLMNWTYGYDWDEEYMTKDAITDIMINSEFLNHGANLLMHDREWTNEALEDIVKGLQDKGYEMADPHAIQLEN